MTPEHESNAPEYEFASQNDDQESPTGEDMLRAVLETSDAPAVAGARQKIEGVVVGQLVGVQSGSEYSLLVDYDGNPAGSPLPAMTTVAVREEDAGRDAALAFQGGDPRKPILLGLIWNAGKTAAGTEGEAKPGAAGSKDEETAQSVRVERDGEKLKLTAEKEIVLECGKASVTLTRAGKVIIRGTYILSRSSGANRIVGGSIHLN
jgi:hypothetical protein